MPDQCAKQRPARAALKGLTQNERARVCLSSSTSTTTQGKLNVVLRVKITFLTMAGFSMHFPPR